MATHTIDPDGTGDYSDLAAWEAAQQQDLVTNTTTAIAECTSSSGGNDTGGGGSTTLSGWTTNSTYYIEIRGIDDNAGKWNDSNYILEGASWNTANGISGGFGGGADDVFIRNIQILRQNASSGGISVYTNGAGEWRVERCIIKNNKANPTPAGISFTNIAGITSKAANNIIYDLDTGITAVNNNGAYYFYNNTVHNCDTAGYNGGGTNSTVINCVADDCVDGFTGTWNSNSDYNASDIASDAPGSNSQNGTDTTFVDEANDDFHLSTSDTVCLDNGTDVSGDSNYPVTVDNENTTRAGTWDIGAHQATATGGASQRLMVLTS